MEKFGSGISIPNPQHCILKHTSTSTTINRKVITFFAFIYFLFQISADPKSETFISTNQSILHTQEDDESSPWAEDRKDLDPSAQTSFIYNPAPELHLEAHRKRLPVYRAKNQLLYLMERHQVKFNHY